MYVVTGGAGFIGSRTVGMLSERGERVVVSDWFGHADKWKNLAKHHFDEFVFPEELNSWLAQSHNKKRVKGIIHMGAISATTETDVDLITRSNFQLSSRLWRWCTEYGCPMIYASSAATYGDGSQGFEDRFEEKHLAALRPLNPYAWSKHAFDRKVFVAIRDGEPCPPKWAGLKFFNVYGPNEYHKGTMKSVVAKNFDTIISGKPLQLFKSYKPEYADGEQKRDFVYVDDCVKVIMWMLGHEFPSSVYNVGSGTARSWLDLGRAVFKAAGLAEKIEFIEMPENLQPRYQYFTKASMQKLKEAGYGEPFRSLEDGISKYVKQYLKITDPYA